MPNANEPGDKGQPDTNQQQDPDNQPKYVTEEAMGRMVNQAITNHFKRIDFGKHLAPVFEQFSATLAEKFAPKQEPQGEGHASSSSSKADDPVVKGMQKQLQDMKKQLDDANSKTEQERARARDTKLRQTLSEQLQTAGVSGHQLRHAVGILVDADKRVKYGDDESLIFAGKDGDVDLATGLAEWLKTDEGKLYLPPRGASGSNGGTGGAPQKINGAPSREDVANALFAFVNR